MWFIKKRGYEFCGALFFVYRGGAGREFKKRGYEFCGALFFVYGGGTKNREIISKVILDTF